MRELFTRLHEPEDIERELDRLSRCRRVWDDSGSEDETGGLIQLCRDWIKPYFFVAEIGCCAGVSTSVFACFAERVLAVDPFDLATARGYRQIPIDRLKIARMRFAVVLARYLNILHLPSCSPDAAFAVEGGALDAVYIDGDHTREAFVADVRAWLPKLRQNGLLMGHDYGQVAPYFGELGLPKPEKIYSEDSWVVPCAAIS